MTKEKATPIIILGMHRSGTSCLAGALQQAGLYLGKVSEYNAYNKKGNREHNEIMHLNDSILLYNNSSWYSPPKKPLTWSQEHTTTAKKLINSFEEKTETGYWGFKDPRTLLTFPFWETLLSNPVFIGTFRHPLLATESICKRKDTPLSQSSALSLWETYNKILISTADKYAIPLIPFEKTSKDYQEKLKKIARLLKLPTPENIDFYDESLVTKNLLDYDKAKQNCSEYYFQLYEKMIQKI